MEDTKKPAELLRDEHEAVLQKLTALEKVFGSLDKREAISAELKELASFFKTDFWLHFDKEEKAFFPEFDNFMPRGAGPIAVMMEEHTVIRNTNEVTQEAIARYLNHADDAETRQTITQNGTHFINFLRAHIKKEDGILFMMADMHLNQKQNEKVVRLFQEMDKH